MPISSFLMGLLSKYGYNQPNVTPNTTYAESRYTHGPIVFAQPNDYSNLFGPYQAPMAATVNSPLDDNRNIANPLADQINKLLAEKGRVIVAPKENEQNHTILQHEAIHQLVGPNAVNETELYNALPGDISSRIKSQLGKYHKPGQQADEFPAYLKTDPSFMTGLPPGSEWDQTALKTYLNLLRVKSPEKAERLEK